MTREAFIRKWLANPQKQYTEECRDEMRNDLDLVISSALRQTLVNGRSEQLCDFLEWYDENLTFEQREMEVKTYVDMKSHNCH